MHVLDSLLRNFKSAQIGAHCHVLSGLLDVISQQEIKFSCLSNIFTALISNAEVVHVVQLGLK